MGFLWGRLEALRALPTFREYFIPDTPPFKIEVGTFVYENIAGMDAAISYLEGLGRSLAAAANNVPDSRRANIVHAMEAIRAYEASLSLELLSVLRALGAQVFGLADPGLVRHRVPTLCFNLKNIDPAIVAGKLARSGIGVRDGHMYSPRLMNRLGLSSERGAVRASFVHYNTIGEIHRFGSALAEIAQHESPP
jgi:selenocysteine lyase/cysteine desulfurase